MQHKRTNRRTCSVPNFIDRVMKVPPRLDSQVKQSVSKIEGAPVDALMRWANNILLKNTLDEIIT